MQIHQSVIIGTTLSVTLVEKDELGRQVGNIVTLEMPASEALLVALSAQTAKMDAAQTAVIAQAKTDVADGKPVTKLVATVADIAKEA